MRKVFENSMVGHVWANASQEEGRSHNGNLWFSGATIYSYRTPIARRMPGGRVFLVTSERYSITTSGKHMPAVHRAIASGATVFQVPDVAANDHAAHTRNVGHLGKVYADTVARMKRTQAASWGNPERTLQELADDIRNYVGAIGGAEPDNYPDPARDAAAVRAKWAERAARDADPATAAKREADRAKRKAAKERKEQAARDEQRTKWLAGEYVYSRFDDGNGGAVLRVRGDVLETSQGAGVPLAHAVKAFRMVKRCRDAGQSWARNGHTIRVGHFQVDAIDALGNMRAGCHRINWPEIERVARALGVFDTADTGDVSDVLDATQEAHAA